jgi:hypothetical protein
MFVAKVKLVCSDISAPWSHVNVNRLGFSAVFMRVTSPVGVSGL